MFDQLKVEKPNVCILDTTIKTNSENYKVLVFCYPSVVNSKTIVSAVSIVSEESDENIKRCFELYKETCHPRVFLVDKDLQQANMITEVFEGVKVYFCYWHVKTYIRKVIATSNTFTKNKSALKKAFDDLLVSKNQEQFAEREANFLSLSENIQIHLPGKKEPELLLDYYKRCWSTEPQTWALFHRQQDLFDCQGDRTTNRAESTFGHLKVHLRSMFGSKPPTLSRVIPVMVKHLENQHENQSNRLKIIKPGFEDQLNEASFDLFDPAVMKFCNSLKTFKSVTFEKIALGAVTIKSTNGSQTYKTYENCCSCSYHQRQKSCPRA